MMRNGKLVMIHVVPALVNYLEYVAIARTFPQALHLCLGKRCTVEYAVEEPMAGLAIPTEVIHPVPDADIVLQTSGSWVTTGQLWVNKTLIEMMQTCHATGGIVASICCGVGTLAAAFEGHEHLRLTGFPVKTLVSRFKELGWDYTGAQVEVNREERLITARTQMQSWDWVKQIKLMAAELWGQNAVDELCREEVTP